MRVRLLERYVRDTEWWFAYPADPRWTYHDPGEEMEVSTDEAEQMLRDGIAEPVKS